MKSITILTYFILYSCFVCLRDRPVLFFHGLGGSCERTTTHFKDYSNYKCIETGADSKSFIAMSSQAETGCAEIKNIISADPDSFRHGFYLAGLSQGGLLARHILFYCNVVNNLVKGLITFGTPNMGIEKVPLFNEEDKKDDNIIVELFKKNIETKLSFLSALNIPLTSAIEYTNKSFFMVVFFEILRSSC